MPESGRCFSFDIFEVWILSQEEGHKNDPHAHVFNADNSIHYKVWLKIDEETGLRPVKKLSQNSMSTRSLKRLQSLMDEYSYKVGSTWRRMYDS